MLIYRLVLKKGALFVKLEIQGSRRILYLDTLKAAATAKDLPALQFLIKTHLRASGGHSVDTLSFQEISLPSSIAKEALGLLVASGSLYYQDVVLKPGGGHSLFWKGDLISEKSARISPFLNDIPLEKADLLFPGWAILLNRWVEIKTDVAWKWMERFQSGPQIIEGVEKKRFLEEKPDILWSKKEKAADLTVIPRIVLTDATGSFANLAMDYPGVGTVAFDDLAPHVGGKTRLKNDEHQFEKDLLEAGFQRKVVGVSRYYCGGLSALTALKLLLEVGWRCTNMQGKTVLLQSGSHMRVSQTEDRIEMVGTVQFQTKESGLQNVKAADLRGRLFVDLDDSSVGLIDGKSLLGLPSGQWEGGVFSLPKARMGELAPLVGKPGIDWSDALVQTLKALEKKEGFSAETLDERFQGTLLPYQEKGVQWLQFLQKSGFGALLSDEMGLGKTVQALAFFSQLRTNLPILIVAPTSLIFNWQQEIHKFWPTASVYVHGGAERIKCAEHLQAKALILTSYGVLRADQEIFASVDFEGVALDESQAIKSSRSQTAGAAYLLKSKFRLAITGTPIENKPEELWSQFRFLMPDLLGELGTFQSTPSSALRFRIKPFILKRTKEEAQIHLPEKQDLPQWIEMTEEQQNLYDDTLQSLKEQNLKSPGNHFAILQAILRLRQICVDGRLVGGTSPGAKAEQLMAMAEEWAASNQKALVFSQFASFLRILEADLRKIGIEPLYLDGSVPASERGELVRRFQEEDKPHLFLLSLKAGGVGLNLTAARSAVLIEPWWNEAVERQAIDRAHRIGQKNTLWVHRLLTPKAIEEKMLQVKGRKIAFAEEILSETSEAWSAEDLMELIAFHQS